ncbi:MAG: hypothetical protein ABWW66_01510 [Archaeoglobaceae archaeon]
MSLVKEIFRRNPTLYDLPASAIAKVMKVLLNYETSRELATLRKVNRVAATQPVLLAETSRGKGWLRLLRVKRGFVGVYLLVSDSSTTMFEVLKQEDFDEDSLLTTRVSLLKPDGEFRGKLYELISESFAKFDEISLREGNDLLFIEPNAFGRHNPYVKIPLDLPFLALRKED